jgi:hypothetical protein
MSLYMSAIDVYCDIRMVISSLQNLYGNITILAFKNGLMLIGILLGKVKFVVRVVFLISHNKTGRIT